MYQIMALCSVGRERNHLQEILKDEYEIVFVSGCEQALRVIDRSWKQLRLLLIDLDDESAGGMRLIKAMSSACLTAIIPVVILTKDIAGCAYEEAYASGAIDFIAYDMIPVLMRRRLKNFIEILSAKEEKAAVGMANPMRNIPRNIDDMEILMGGNSIPGSALYDPATQLLTYDAIRSFISEKIGKNRSGTLMLIDIAGLGTLIETMPLEQQQAFLRRLALDIYHLARNDDVLGRFGSDGFILFLPEAHNEALAERMAELLIRTIYMRFQSIGRDRVTCRVGISVADCVDTTVSDLLTGARIALIEARENEEEFRISIAA